MLVGLTGNIAAGKSVAGRYLKTLGTAVLDADQVGRRISGEEAALLEIRRRLPGCVREDGSLDREALAELVFAEPEARRELEAILHPRILAAMQAQTRAIRDQEPEATIIWDAALLFEAGLDSLVDTTLLITAPDDIRLARIMERDGFTREQALSRMRAQWPQERKAALAATAIDNSGTLEQLYRALNGWYADITRKR